MRIKECDVVESTGARVRMDIQYLMEIKKGRDESKRCRIEKHDSRDGQRKAELYVIAELV